MFKRVSRAEPLHEDNDEFRTTNAIIPIKRVAGKRNLIPHDIYAAIDTIIQACQAGDYHLSAQALSEIKTHFSTAQDNLVRVDPTVIISYTLDTGTCKVCVQESVLISVLLMARAMRLTFTVTLMEDIVSAPKSFTEVQIRPDYGERLADTHRFSLAKLVDVNLNKSGLIANLPLVEMHMNQIGEMSSDSVCAIDFLESQTDMVNKVLNNASIIPKE